MSFLISILANVGLLSCVKTPHKDEELVEQHKNKLSQNGKTMIALQIGGNSKVFRSTHHEDNSRLARLIRS
jgi:hypothetical protein